MARLRGSLCSPGYGAWGMGYGPDGSPLRGLRWTGCTAREASTILAMFFRREKPKQITFEDRLEALRRSGFTVEPEPGTGAVRVVRNGCAAVLEQGANQAPVIRRRAGVLFGGEIASLVDGGFQKFFETPSGLRKPALAWELKAIHNFQEDMREALGLESLYNESLGTVSQLYRYDRVQDRDQGVPKRAWET